MRPPMKFKIVYAGENQESVSFVCQHCQVDNALENTYDTYNRPKGTFRKPGECPTCEGTGFAPGPTSRTCPACKGTSVCPKCDGKHSREWSELSREHKHHLSHVFDPDNEHIENFAVHTSRYRNW